MHDKYITVTQLTKYIKYKIDNDVNLNDAKDLSNKIVEKLSDDEKEEYTKENRRTGENFCPPVTISPQKERNATLAVSAACRNILRCGTIFHIPFLLQALFLPVPPMLRAEALQDMLAT